MIDVERPFIPGEELFPARSPLPRYAKWQIEALKWIITELRNGNFTNQQIADCIPEVPKKRIDNMAFRLIKKRKIQKTSASENRVKLKEALRRHLTDRPGQGINLSYVRIESELRGPNGQIISRQAALKLYNAIAAEQPVPHLSLSNDPAHKGRVEPYSTKTNPRDQLQEVAS